MLWNAIPTHPGTATSNRRPTRSEIKLRQPFLQVLASGRRIARSAASPSSSVGSVRHPEESWTRL